MPLGNPKQDLHKFGDNPLVFTQVNVWKQKYRRVVGRKQDEICPLAIPKQISTIVMHTPGYMKIHLYLLKLSSGNENTDGHMEVKHETIIPGHYHTAVYVNF